MSIIQPQQLHPWVIRWELLASPWHSPRQPDAVSQARLSGSKGLTLPTAQVQASLPFGMGASQGLRGPAWLCCKLPAASVPKTRLYSLVCDLLRNLTQDRTVKTQNFNSRGSRKTPKICPWHHLRACFSAGPFSVTHLRTGALSPGWNSPASKAPHRSHTFFVHSKKQPLDIWIPFN